MKVVIVEDELAASENLAYLLRKLDPKIQVVCVLDSVRAAVSYLSEKPEADLIFMDIHLADGLSFEIFEKAPVTVPVIFTTAYDQYALKAFKVNSIDYLLKPIDEEDLASALEQYRVQHQQKEVGSDQVGGLLEMLRKEARPYKSTFLVARGDQLIPLKAERVAYFHIDTGVVKAVTSDGQSFTMDQKLEDLEAQLDPSLFYRANRQFIVRRDAIHHIKYYFNGKLILTVDPPARERIVVSKAKAGDFKEWMSS
jgi:two-component system LytT family response regulator